MGVLGRAGVGGDHEHLVTVAVEHHRRRVGPAAPRTLETTLWPSCRSHGSSPLPVSATEQPVLFDSRKGRNARPPTLVWLENLRHPPCGTGEFEGIPFMAPDVAFPGVIVDGQTDLQTTLVIKVVVSGNDYSVPGAMWDAFVKFDRLVGHWSSWLILVWCSGHRGCHRMATVVLPEGLRIHRIWM